MNNLAQAKSSICSCKLKSEVFDVISDFTDSCRFSYSDDLTVTENAAIAARQGKFKVAELLDFSAKKLEKL